MTVTTYTVSQSVRHMSASGKFGKLSISFTFLAVYPQALFVLEDFSFFSLDFLILKPVLLLLSAVCQFLDCTL